MGAHLQHQHAHPGLDEQGGQSATSIQSAHKDVHLLALPLTSLSGVLGASGESLSYDAESCLADSC